MVCLGLKMSLPKGSDGIMKTILIASIIISSFFITEAFAGNGYFAEFVKGPWTDNIFEWHEQGLITPTEFVNAVGYLKDHKIIELGKKVYSEKVPGSRNIATTDARFDYNHPAFKDQKYSKTYNYEDHEYAVWSYTHSNGMEYKVTKSYDGYLSSFIDDNVIRSDIEVHCPWC